LKFISEDIATILLLLTWINPLGFLIYHVAVLHHPLNYNMILKLGKDPVLFLTDIVFFEVSVYLFITSKHIREREKRDIIKMCYLVPVMNILLSLIGGAIFSGLHGFVYILIEAPFISMYNLLIALYLIALNMRIRPKPLIPTKHMIVGLAVIIEFAIYAILRYFYGPSFYLLISFLIAIVVSLMVPLRFIKAT